VADSVLKEFIFQKIFFLVCKELFVEAVVFGKICLGGMIFFGERGEVNF